MVTQIVKPVATETAVSGAVNSLGESLTTLIDEINAIPLSNARLVQATLTTTASPVAHNLGYIARGFIVVKKTASFDVYENTTATNPDSRRYAMLRTSAGTQTVTLLFF